MQKRIRFVIFLNVSRNKQEKSNKFNAQLLSAYVSLAVPLNLFHSHTFNKYQILPTHSHLQ